MAITEKQADALRAWAKAAPEGSPVYIAYHKGDGQNRHDEFEPAVCVADKTEVRDGKGNLVAVLAKGDVMEDAGGVVQQQKARTVTTDAGGDIDALAALASADPEVALPKRTVLDLDGNRVQVDQPYTRLDIWDALYEQVGSDVVKR